MRIVEQRLALDIAQAKDRAGRRQEEEVEAVRLGGGQAPELGELVLSFEGVDGAVFTPAQDDLARHRPDAGIVARAFEERADRGRALGDPRSAVEKLGGVAKGRVVEGN